MAKRAFSWVTISSGKLLCPHGGHGKETVPAVWETQPGGNSWENPFVFEIPFEENGTGDPSQDYVTWNQVLDWNTTRNDVEYHDFQKGHLVGVRSGWVIPIRT